MSDKNLKLPEMAQDAFVLDRNTERIYRILWSVDPAYLRRLKPEIIDHVVQLDFDYRIRVGELELAMKQAELDTLKQTQQLLNG